MVSKEVMEKVFGTINKCFDCGMEYRSHKPFKRNGRIVCYHCLVDTTTPRPLYL